MMPSWTGRHTEMSAYRDPWTGRFARTPQPPAQTKPLRWHRVVVRLPAIYKPRGPWRRSRDVALQDAVAEGLGSYDRVEGKVILPVPAEIETVDSFDRPAD
jgi:hypothetical protein